MTATGDALPSDEEPCARSTLLQEACREAGAAWARWWFEELQRQGRAVAGGWPGTMSEARSRARAQLGVVNASRRLKLNPTQVELNEAARLTYDSARTVWLRHQTRPKDPA